VRRDLLQPATYRHESIPRGCQYTFAQRQPPLLGPLRLLQTLDQPLALGRPQQLHMPLLKVGITKLITKHTFLLLIQSASWLDSSIELSL
jgi:hypothetical protein